MPQTMPIKWTNLMMTSMIMMSLLTANMFFHKKMPKTHKNKTMSMQLKKPNWKW